MENQLIEMGTRIKDLREIRGLTSEEAAESCGLKPEEYLKLEKGETDIHVGALQLLAKTLGTDITSLLSGKEPRMHEYTITRQHRGVAVARRNAYKYRSLASNFINRKADAFHVTVEPKKEEKPGFNSHPGQEFNMVLKGAMKLYLKDKEMILNEGDSIYFDSGLPHAMSALNNEACEFLALIF
ncbi:XRE family transcriptional regulator [Marinilabiliaceae bacterium ANBcel2]|nr:XRE family transcriptional regulator [Marinilabiliaceae bacterium ANBcel2]